jgi:hypothetical protein
LESNRPGAAKRPGRARGCHIEKNTAQAYPSSLQATSGICLRPGYIRPRTFVPFVGSSGYLACHSYFATKNDAFSIDQNRALDQVGMLRHQFQRFAAGGRVLFHTTLAVKFISGIQEFAVVPGSNQMVEFIDCQALVEIDFLKLDASFAKQTLRVAASGSRRFEIEFHRVIAILDPRNARP